MPVLLALLAGCVPRPYVMDVATLEEVAAEVRGLEGADGADRERLIATVQDRLHARYPELVEPAPGREWWFNAVGGSLASIQVLWCSPREYVALWGSPVPTDGFSGRYPSLDVWDVMVTGRMASHAPDEHTVTWYENGGPEGTRLTSYLARGEGRHFVLEPGAYMIDYGRGWLPGARRVGAHLGHTFVTGDRWSRRQMIRTCSRDTFANWFDPDRRRAIRAHREAAGETGETGLTR